MDLSRAFTKFPIFRVSAPADEPGIHAMLGETPMRVGGMDLVYDRRPEFRRALDYQATRHVTTIADVEGELRGFGSYSWGPRLVDGKAVTAMYIGDFRVKADRRVAAGWRSCYPKLVEIFKTDPEFGPCEWIYTGILSANLAAKRSLAENRKANGFFYHPLAHLAMVNTFFRPRRRPSLPGLRIVRGSDVGEAKLREFLIVTNRSLFLGYDFGTGHVNEWDRRLEIWPGFAAKNFFVALDSDERIVACTLPWSPAEAKRMRVTGLDLGARMLFGALARIGVRVPETGKPFRTLYLTHLNFAKGLADETRASIIAAFLAEAFRLPNIRDYQMVSYADARELRMLKALRNRFTQVTEVDLYLVTTEEAPPTIPANEGVAFEMALV